LEYTSFALTARLIGTGTDASIAFSECVGQRPDGIDNWRYKTKPGKKAGPWKALADVGYVD
jgi:hypothetical protein